MYVYLFFTLLKQLLDTSASCSEFSWSPQQSAITQLRTFTLRFGHGCPPFLGSVITYLLRLE